MDGVELAGQLSHRGLGVGPGDDATEVLEAQVVVELAEGRPDLGIGAVEDVANELRPPLLARAHEAVALRRVLVGEKRRQPVDVLEQVVGRRRQRLAANLGVGILALDLGEPGRQVIACPTR